MKFRLMLVLVAATFVAVAAMAPVPATTSPTCEIAQAQLSATGPLSDVENPCDPTPNILAACKAMHGHFSAQCCCCITH